MSNWLDPIFREFNANAGDPILVANPDGLHYSFGDSRRDDSSVSWGFKGVIGRPVSRAEALQIADQIIERAERERIQLAEGEAKRGIQWEGDK